MIVKVQLPLMSNETNPPCLVYDKYRKHQQFIECNDQIIAGVGTNCKAYFNAEIDAAGKLVIDWSERLPIQDW